MDSTNNYLKRKLKEAAVEEGTVILADYQTAGRGQGIKSWHSEKGLNIIMSVLFLSDLHANRHFFISEFVSLAITDMLESVNISAKIKWPNDIFAENNKIAGILIENTLQGSRISHTIAGMGINVNEEIFPPDLPNPVSIKQITGKIFKRDELVTLLTKKLHDRHTQLVSGKYEALHEEYNSKIYKGGEFSEYVDSNGTFQAAVREIKKDGRLILEKKDGSLSHYLFGEIQMNL